MANGAYIGVDGIAKKLKNIYIGVDGMARPVKKAYIGVEGIAKLFWTTSNPLPDFLIDFYGNIEGTKENPIYAITGWKGTLNGEPSTEIVVPDNETILL